MSRRTVCAGDREVNKEGRTRREGRMKKKKNVVCWEGFDRTKRGTVRRDPKIETFFYILIGHVATVLERKGTGAPPNRYL